MNPIPFCVCGKFGPEARPTGYMAKLLAAFDDTQSVRKLMDLFTPVQKKELGI